MTTLVNAKPRFALEGNRLFCYVTSRYYDITPGLILEAEEGMWPLEKVAELIRGGATIERALVTRYGLNLQHRLNSLDVVNQRLAEENEELRDEIERLKQQMQTEQVRREDSEPQVDRVAQAVRDFDAATPSPAEGDKVEQAKQDFLSGSEEEITAIGTGQLASAELPPNHYDKPADVEGAMAAEEAPPKGE